MGGELKTVGSDTRLTEAAWEPSAQAGTREGSSERTETGGSWRTRWNLSGKKGQGHLGGEAGTCEGPRAGKDAVCWEARDVRPDGARTATEGQTAGGGPDVRCGRPRWGRWRAGAGRPAWTSTPGRTAGGCRTAGMDVHTGTWGSVPKGTGSHMSH